jgi:Ca-activated chloride channel homolog
MGVILWDGNEHWLFPLQKVGDKKALGQQIAGMNQGDLGSFQNILSMSHEALKKSTSNLKHIIVFSDGDPGGPTPQLMQAIVSDRITVSTVLISGHSPPDTMISMADQGKGRYYNVTSPNDLPQIFIKETAVILKSAIYEEPFKPQLRAASEVVRGIGAGEYPTLLGYVATTPKGRAETPLWTDKGDPLLAHWQYGLGRAVAFTSDAKSRWAKIWLNWDKYRQFWSQIGQWALRRLENADFTTEVTVDKGQGLINLEALDSQGNYRNFLNLEAIVVSPKGERQRVHIDQTGPGHYEAAFPTKDTGAYLIHVLNNKEGQQPESQVVGASVNYSPEFTSSEPNFNLLHRITESGNGRMLDPGSPASNPFEHDRRRTFQPKDLWDDLMKIAVLLFVLDVGVRRIQIDREEWRKGMRVMRRWIFFWQGVPRAPEADDSLAALLNRRDRVRAETPTQTTAPIAPLVQPRPDLFTPEKQISEEELPDVEAGGAAPGGVAAPVPEEPKKPEDASTTTSRLLEAKRRAQKRKP